MERVHDTPGGERARERGRKEVMVVGGVAGRAKIVPKLCDLCCPAKHSHQSRRNGCSSPTLRAT